MKKIFTLVVLTFLMGTAFAQQDAVWSQYIFNGLMVNPAYAGSRGTLSSTLFVRKQWLGFKGSPFTQSIAVHSPIKHRRNAVGGYLVHDQVGISRTVTFSAIYSYMLPIERVGTLAFGLSGGASHFSNPVNNLYLGDVADPAADANTVSVFLPNFGAGVYFYDEKWFVSFAVPELITNSLVQPAFRDAFKSRQDRLYLLSGGLLLPLNIHLKFRPTVLGKFTKGAPLQVAINTTLIVNDRFWVGVGYRTNDAMIFNLGVQISDFFRIAYAYDLPTTSMFSYQTGSHEFMIGFDLKHKFKHSTPLMHIDDPRYF